MKAIPVTPGTRVKSMKNDDVAFVKEMKSETGKREKNKRVSFKFFKRVLVFYFYFFCFL